jgi:hypothetical protein
VAQLQLFPVKTKVIKYLVKQSGMEVAIASLRPSSWHDVCIGNKLANNNPAAHCGMVIAYARLVPLEYADMQVS